MKLAEDLRRSVLQAAIEGKLTGGKCEGWRYVRLGDVIVLISGADLPSDQHNQAGNGIPYITGASNIVNSSLIINRWTTTPKKIAKRGDILLTCKGTIGANCVLGLEEAHIARQVMAIRVTGADTNFVHYYIQHYVDTLKKQAKSMIPGIERKNIIEAPFPLPPIEEQHRIVSRLDAILPLIDELESAENELEALTKKFPGDMRDSLLQAAIEGKLTGSNTDNWRYVRLGECALIGSGKTPAKDFLSSEGTIPFYRVADMNLQGNERIMNEANTFLTEKYKGKLTPYPSVIFPKNGGAVFTNKRRFLNKPALIDLNTGFIFPTDVNIEYLFYWFSSVDLSMYAIGTALPTVNASIISNLIIPLPPIDEQHKIAARLNELLPLCEALENLS